MLQVAICEDNANDARLLAGHIKQAGLQVELHLFACGGALLEGFAPGRFHLIFLDIYLPDMQGTELARRIRQTDAQVVIAFTTSSQEFALTGYRLNALKYLVKPVQVEDVAHTLELAQRLKGQRAVCTVFIRQQKTDIELADICYVEVRNHTCYIHTQQAVLESGNTIEEMSALLPPPHFVKCHRSFIVNLNHVREISRDFIMKNGDTVYIRGKDLSRMKQAWAQYLFQAVRE